MHPLCTPPPGQVSALFSIGIVRNESSSHECEHLGTLAQVTVQGRAQSQSWFPLESCEDHGSWLLLLHPWRTGCISVKVYWLPANQNLSRWWPLGTTLVCMWLISIQDRYWSKVYWLLATNCNPINTLVDIVGLDILTIRHYGSVTSKIICDIMGLDILGMIPIPGLH